MTAHSQKFQEAELYPHVTRTNITLGKMLGKREVRDMDWDERAIHSCA